MIRGLHIQGSEPRSTGRIRWCLAGAFAISYLQEPLYSGNQNTYFLHGLAGHSANHLGDDWLAQTADPFPVFSELVGLTARLGAEPAFYLLYMLLLACYAFSMFCIADSVPGLPHAVHGYKDAVVFGVLLVDPLDTASHGIAMQQVLGPVLQPSVFGVLLVASMAAFLEGRLWWATLSAVAAATVHGSYALGAAVLSLTYLAAETAWGRPLSQTLRIGAVALLLALPYASYVATRFMTDDPNIELEAMRVLVDVRMPHHAKVQTWFDQHAILRLVIVLAAIACVRRTRLFPVLSGTLSVAVVLSLIQVIRDSDRLALLFPWRMSVFLVPVAVMTVFVRAFGWVATKYQAFSVPERPAAWACVAAVLATACWGTYQTVRLLCTPQAGVNELSAAAARMYEAGDVYLIPPDDLDSFRLAAGVPVFVDFKSHPYRGPEILEWHRRLRIARNVFDGVAIGDSCKSLRRLLARREVTKVVIRNGHSLTAGCTPLRLVFGGTEYSIFAPTSTAPRTERTGARNRQHCANPPCKEPGRLAPKRLHPNMVCSQTKHVIAAYLSSFKTGT